MKHTSPDPKQKRELTQTAKVKTDKAFATDVRQSKVHPTVRKLTAWRKQNRLSQPKAVAEDNITFTSLSPHCAAGRKGAGPLTHTRPGSSKSFCSTTQP